MIEELEKKATIPGTVNIRRSVDAFARSRLTMGTEKLSVEVCVCVCVCVCEREREKKRKKEKKRNYLGKI